MVLNIAKQRFLSNLVSLRLLVAFIIIETLFLASALVAVREFSQRQRLYHSSVQEHAESVKETRTYAELSVTIDRPPSVMSIFCAGSDRNAARSITVAHSQAPVMTDGTDADNPLMAVFSTLDLISIIQIILSLTVLLFAYDSISGEKEQGTLRLILSNRVPRHTYLAGNFLGGLASIYLPLIVGFISVLLIVLISGNVSLGAGHISRLALLMVFSLIYLSLFYAVGMLFSIKMKRSSTALVFLLFVWVFVVMILPPGAAYVAQRIKPVKSKAVIDAEAESLRNEWLEKVREYTQQHPEPRTEYVCRRGRYVYTGSLPHAFHLGYAEREYAAWLIDGSIYSHNLQIEYQDRIYQLYHEYMLTLEEQAALSRTLCRLSPSWIFYRLATILFNTDPSIQTAFLEQAQQYRKELIGYINDNNGLSSYRLITYNPRDRFMTGAQLKRLAEEQGKKAVDHAVKRVYNPDEAVVLSLESMPRFTFHAPDIAAGFVRSMPSLFILILLNFICIAGCWVLFIRFDIR